VIVSGSSSVSSAVFSVWDYRGPFLIQPYRLLADKSGFCNAAIISLAGEIFAAGSNGDVWQVNFYLQRMDAAVTLQIDGIEAQPVLMP